MNNSFFKIKDGEKPILIVSIHACHAESPNNPKKLAESSQTKELNEELHTKLGYYSFIYTGYRTNCIRDTINPLVNTVERMLGKYKKLGVISLHARGRSRTRKNYPDSIFELLTLKGRTLDFKIVAHLWTVLHDKGIVFDYNFQRNTSAEVVNLHKKYNDKEYKKGKYTLGHDPRDNKLQIAHFEFDDWKKKEKWINEGSGVDQRFYVSKVLGEILVNYVS